MWICTFGNNLFLPIKGGLFIPGKNGNIEIVSICFYQNDKNKAMVNDVVKNGRSLSVKLADGILTPGRVPDNYSANYSAKIGANELTHLKNASQKLEIVEGSYEWFVNLNKVQSIITLKDVKMENYYRVDIKDASFKAQLKAGITKILVEQYPYPLKEEFMEELTDLLTDFENGLGKKCCKQLFPFVTKQEEEAEYKSQTMKELGYLFSFEKEIALKAIPLAYGMSRFKKRFGRIPQIKEIAMMINPEKFNVKTFQEFITLVAGTKEGYMSVFSHETRIGLSYIYEIFSTKYAEAKGALFSKGIDITELNLKDAAINIFKSGKNIQPDLIVKGLRALTDYLKLEGRERQLLSGILSYLSLLPKFENLTELVSKPAELVFAIQSSKYECIEGGEEMARACARLMMPQDQFDVYQRLYVESAKKALKAPRTIPTVSGEIENTRYSWAFITAEDVRAYLAGLETNCCQHLFGAGGSCVRFMAGNPDKSGIFLVLKDGETVAQSFVWHHQVGGTVCFDNIETLGNEIRENVWNCYEAFASVLESMAPMFGYKRLTIGTGYSDVNLDHLPDCSPAILHKLETIPGGEHIYSDADRQKIFKEFTRRL